MEIYNWVKNIGFPYSGEEQFNKLSRPDNLDRQNSARRTTKTGAQSGGTTAEGDRNLYSEIQISIMSSKNNPVVRTTLHDTFPLNLSGLTYTTQDTDATYLTADVTFAYSYYEFLAL